jgi:hypothetical protein
LATATLTACGLTQYEPDAVPSDDTGPLGGDADTDVDADSDTDVDSDTDADVEIRIDSLTPSSGTTAGGLEVVIVGGPFDSSAQVKFDGTKGGVLSSSTNVLTVVTPGGSEGAVDVEIITDDGYGKATGGFTYMADGTGYTGAIGEIYWLDFKGGYWTSTPTDEGYGWWSPVVAETDLEIWELYNSNANGCSADYSYGGEQVYILDDLGVSSSTLSSGSGSINMSWNSSSSVLAFEKTFTSISQLDLGKDYNLQPITPTNGWPEFGGEDFLTMPTAVTLSTPNIDASSLPLLNRNSLQFRWSGGNGGDLAVVLLELRNADQTSVDQTVTCVWPNTGSASVPSSVWTKWSSNRIVAIVFGVMASSGGGQLDVNNSNAQVAGTYFVYGGGQTQ